MRFCFALLKNQLVKQNGQKFLPKLEQGFLSLKIRFSSGKYIQEDVLFSVFCFGIEYNFIYQLS